MNERQGKIHLSATDVANHLSCRHLTALNLRLAKGEISEPSWDNPHLRTLQQRGIEHEKAYKDHLHSRKLSIVDLSNESETAGIETTLAAMHGGADAIIQADLASGEWRGRADVLLRVERPSRLGPWSYEPADCKLARETKAETVLQLCLYADLVAELQGIEPEFFHVVRPHVGFQLESYRVSAFAAYYRTIIANLAATAKRGSSGTHPEPVAHCDICRWWKECDFRRRGDDHLSFVAGAAKLQRKELASQGISTLESLAKIPLPIPFRPARGSREGYVRIREQARIQLEARSEGRPKFESLRIGPGEGLFRLPAPSAGDIFLDLEGDPFVEEGGREYLFGMLTADADGKLVYSCRWALDRAKERAAFEQFIDTAFERMKNFPDLHIYHFGTYEPGAIKRLMLRYASREEEVDRLLRGELFVDLHVITKESVRASVEQYSLKDMERFCNYVRTVPLLEANQARHFVEHQLEINPAASVTDEARVLVEGYNEDDCRATERLRLWLEALREKLIASGTEVPRPMLKDTSPSEEVSAHQRRVAVLFDALTVGLPAEPKDRTREQAARWLLAHALDWHRREEKVKWWEFFSMKDLSEEELYDEKSAVAGLSHRRRMPKTSPRERAPIDQYHYPQQECSIREGDTLYTLDEQKFGEVLATDPVARTFDVKKPIKLDELHPSCVFAHTRYSTKEQSESILRLANWIIANGIDAPGTYRAARDLLLRNPPRLARTSLGGAGNDSVVQVACRAGLALDHSVLPIQGPPGAGKTFTGARMISTLVSQGSKVGVTAVSHKVIRKLLEDVATSARETRVDGVRCAHRKDTADPQSTPVVEIDSNGEALQSLRSGAVNVLGGTSWVWSREEFMDSVDVLFVDEAGQMSLANVLACAPAGKSLVLLGDPQQLEQPQRGSHPEGSDISALAHLLEGRRTISATQGLFLDETWRLHPVICSFTSEVFYEGRLFPRPGLERQNIQAQAPFCKAGLWFAPVVHEGNQNHSVEEVEQVAALVEVMTRAGSTWTDRQGNQQNMTGKDILVVAPYNDQVNRLIQRLPGVAVGTVDRFQGQEAAVVIYSMTTSSPEDAPRGMEFLYNLNRFNVATSRACCACIVVASPRLLTPECHTPHQMELANTLCRYVESGERLALRALTASAD